MGIADDVLSRTDRLSQDRVYWLGVWMDIARLVLPTENAVNAFTSIIAGTNATRAGGIPAPNSPTKVKTIYDNTGLWAVDRLGSGMESLVTPQAEKWHGLGLDDLIRSEPSDEEKIYLDKLRNFMFGIRYDPRGGFISAHQKALRSTIAFGTGVIYVEEGDGRPRSGEKSSIIRYRYCPLTECLLATNDIGQVDTNHRVTTMTVRQLAQKFGKDKLSARVQGLLEAGNLDMPITCVHAVMPRQEAGSKHSGELYGQTVKGSPVASYYIEQETRHLISDGGFFEFPFSVYHWLQQDNGPYAESPVMLALSEIKSLQAMGKSELRAFQQWTDPPLGTVNDGVMNRPNLNARAINPGAVGPNGELRVKPIITATNPDFAEKVMDVRRNNVRETLYVNLFQILIRNPEMTATEAMLRANEKGELLGPAGGKIQAALSHMIDRELAILERKGIYDPRSSLFPPESIQGRSIGVKFTSPLDRLRRANEGLGITRLLDVTLPIAKVKPDVLDNFDIDKTIRNLREIYGAPADVIVPESVLAERRKQTMQEANTAKMLGVAQQGADAAKSASIATRNMGESAVMTPQIMNALNDFLKRMRTGAESAGGAATPQALGATNAILQQFGEAPAGPAQPFGS